MEEVEVGAGLTTVPGIFAVCPDCGFALPLHYRGAGVVPLWSYDHHDECKKSWWKARRRPKLYGYLDLTAEDRRAFMEAEEWLGWSHSR